MEARRRCRWGRWRLLPGLVVAAVSPQAVLAQAPEADPTEILFYEDFEGDLDAWTFPYGHGQALRPTESGRALELAVRDLPVYALIAGSEGWGDVRMEGEVLFPDADDAYLGFIWDYVDDGRRIDFGSAYIKGNGNYVQANDHHDTNVSRTFYPELRADLAGARAIVLGEWQRFALELFDDEAHLYVGDMSRPVLTLRRASPARGAIGFKPRNPGAPVLVDEVRVRRISRPSWDGRAQPDPPYDREAFLTRWWVLGPTASFMDVPELHAGVGQSVTDAEGRLLRWERVEADHRGALATGQIVEFRCSRRVAYFRTRFRVAEGADVRLALSTVDDVAMWLDGAFLGFGGRGSAAWWDAPWNSERGAIAFPESLEPGEHELVVRVVGGNYARGGFYLWLDAGS